MAQVVIAVRGGPQAKSRCAEALSGRDRAGLVAAMLRDMLAATARCEAIAQTWVVTPTPELAELAAREGARVLHQAAALGLNPAFEQALARMSEDAPYDPVLMLPGDLPRLDPGDLAAAALLTRSHAVVLAQALDGGTGLLGLRAGARLAPAFGPDSFRRHLAAAEREGHSVARLATPSLSQDVDGAADLARLLELGPDTLSAAFLRSRHEPRIPS